MVRFSATIGVTLTNKELVKEVMAEKDFEHMKLENQLCFLLYASSREMTKRYKPLLDKLNVTYPQYLALLLLWEHEELNVKRMGELLYLDSGTLTPMLKRMEQHGIIMRKRSAEDERSVTIRLTDEGRALQKTAADIPIAMLEQTGRSKEELKQLKQSLYEVLNTLHGQKIRMPRMGILIFILLPEASLQYFPLSLLNTGRHRALFG